MANVDNIRDALHREPFRAFTLEVAGGKSYIVRHPEVLIIPPIRRPRESILWDEGHTHFIDVTLIVDVIVPNAAGVEDLPAAGGEGS